MARIRRRLEVARRKGWKRYLDGRMALGELEDALAAAHHWVGLDPLDDEAQYRLIELLYQAGHRADALRQYEAYASLIAAELEVEPLEETRQLVERIRSAPGAGLPRRDGSRLPVPAPAALPAAIRPPLPATTDRTVAVLPFLNLSADTDNEYFSDGITEELINTLGRVGSLRVAARTSSFAYKGKQLNICKIGQRLRVQSVVEGSVRKVNDRLRITVQLIAAANGYQLWAGIFERLLDDVFAVQEEIARAVASALLGKLDGSSEQALRQRSTERSAAYNHYLLGRYQWNRRTPEGLNRAVEHFTQAVEIDPEYARAYAGLADAYVAMSHFQYRPPREVIPLAEAAGRRALELDPLHPESQTTFAHILDSFHWCWEEAERGYRRAIELDPRHASAHIWLGDLLTALGRHDEALACGAVAVELEPLSVPIRFQWAAELYRARRFQEAIVELGQVLEMDPAYFAARVFIAFAHACDGRPEEGVEATRLAVDVLGPVAPLLLPLGYCLALAGRTAEAWRIARQLDAATERFVVPAVHRAVIYGALGELDTAYGLVMESLEERYAQFIFFGVDPVFDPLRSDPRFGEVLGRMGLPGGAAPSLAAHTPREEDRRALATRSILEVQ